MLRHVKVGHTKIQCVKYVERHVKTKIKLLNVEKYSKRVSTYRDMSKLSNTCQYMSIDANTWQYMVEAYDDEF